MPDPGKIYDQHRAAFAGVSAYVIAKNGERVATIAFKFPRDGAGRLYAYVHWFGSRMVRGFAAGGGYDKRTAAAANAAVKIGPPTFLAGLEEEIAAEGRRAFMAALAKDGGSDWTRCLEEAGFTVWQAV